MKTYHIIILFCVATIIIACSDIPNKSVFIPLDSEELASAMKQDSLFEDFYKDLLKDIKDFNEIDKAKYNDITYRHLFKAQTYFADTTIGLPIVRQCMSEWVSTYGIYDSKVDSVIDYWEQYITDHSLNRFVKIEFEKLDKEYYSYGNDVKEVDLGFRITPTSAIEQVKFNYSYSAKINKYKGDKHNCILTSPVYSSVVRYWKADYSDEKVLKNLTTASFKRDYDIDIEITDVRINGINYRLSDIYLPTSIKDYNNNTYDFMESYYRKHIIKDLLCKDYVELYEYILNREREILKTKYPREVEFMEYVEKQ